MLIGLKFKPDYSRGERVGTSDLLDCGSNPEKSTVSEKKLSSNELKGSITSQDAEVVAKIVAGPRTTNGDFLWYGTYLAGTIRNGGDSD